ncbi:MAG: ATP-binding protein [Desulfobacterales bacterium]|nr:ATP-binding protein [Desulfobacterales bacterium]
MHRIQSENYTPLIRGIAHDLNNILTGMFGCTELIRTHSRNPEKVEKYLEILTHGTEMATDLVETLKGICPRTGQAREAPYALPVHEVVSETVHFLRPTIPSSIRVEQEIVSKALVLTTPGRIRQVVINLVINACQAIEAETKNQDQNQASGDGKETIRICLTDVTLPEDSSPALRSGISGNAVRLEVSDTGPGIPAADLDRIFEPYFTTKSPGRGSGLGLAVADSVVRESRGCIKVLSPPDNGEGRGACFHVYWPASSV